MYIRKEDFNYFEGLHKSLDEEKGKKFLKILLKTGNRRIGEDIKKIQIVGDEIFDSRGIEPHEFITKRQRGNRSLMLTAKNLRSHMTFFSKTY